MVQHDSISISSYNCHGLGSGKIEYIAGLCLNFDFVLVQEHWLISDNLDMFVDKIPGISCHGVSPMSTNKSLSGRPYGGCSILWKSSLNCNISPVETTSKRNMRGHC